jgi:tyrosyl-tRNA synthetase
MLLQAFDFYHLRKELHCELQVGATDQWGNITAGTDLCRKKLGATVWGLTFPLMTKADGTKYGKTASGAVYLDPKKTSPYRFYQFCIQLEDADVMKITKMLSFAEQTKVSELEQQHAANPGARVPHKSLARELTELVHGKTAAEDAVRASDVLFGGGLDGLSEGTFNDLIGEVPSRDLAKPQLEGPGLPLIDMLVHSGLCPSKGQARKDIEQGGIYINTVREPNIQRAVTAGDLLFGRHLLLRKGKRNYVVLTAK